ncbi:phage recombination protein Bet [Nonomuraea sp. NPDC050663]|uniref:phage recombination protein Bet n=1 Tax=Nonomuraea sp. NPDC050663 TaxID=3364370 RepID=UPI0037B33E9C
MTTATDNLPAVQANGALAIQADQTMWTAEQRHVLAQLGVAEDCPNAVLAGYLHLCQRRGLDPFLKQVYLIGRRQRQQDNSYRTVYTPQTGIDGYRVLAQRAAHRAGVKYGYEDTIWFAPDGSKHEVWLWNDRPPAAAKITVVVNGQRFSGVANFASYADTDRDGKPKNRWKTDPAGMTAKCAEAQALRKAFPEDLGDLYTHEEMEHLVDDEEVSQAPPQTVREAAQAKAGASATVMVSKEKRHLLARKMDELGVTDKLGYLHLVHPDHTFESSGDLTAAQAEQVLAALHRGDHLQPVDGGGEPDEAQAAAGQPEAAKLSKSKAAEVNTWLTEAGIDKDARFAWLAEQGIAQVSSTSDLTPEQATEAIIRLTPLTAQRREDLRQRIINVWTDMDGTPEQLSAVFCREMKVPDVASASNSKYATFLKKLADDKVKPGERLHQDEPEF